MIKLLDINISFSDRTLLRNVNLTIPKGETFVLIGPSGLGKSTLLKTVAGLVTPSRGSVIIDNQDLHRSTRKQRSELINKMGMLFQKNALFDSLTVFENVAFPLRESSTLGNKEIKTKVEEFLTAVGLEGAGQKFPDEISGGMQKRVGIARALILNPEIILYDDPTAGLDPITSRLIIELIIKLNKKNGSTVMAITNDMNRAYQMADRMGIILDQTLIETGTVSETKTFGDPRVQQFISGDFEGPLTDITTKNQDEII